MAEFTLDGYRALLAAFLDRGYTARGFAEVEPQARHLVLRHDLDMSVQAALPIAEIERDLGLSATYFVLVRTEMYNPFSAAAKRDLERIVGLGHEIGLHFDPSLYGSGREGLDQAVGRECAALESVYSVPVRVVSFHRPPARLLGLEGRLAGRNHAYEARFWREMGYCSDSRGEWHHGHPLDHAAVAEGRALQLLTHPIWWTAGPADSVKEKLDRFARARFDLLRAELARNCEPYRDAAENAGGKSEP